MVSEFEKLVGLPMSKVADEALYAGLKALDQMD